MKLLQVAFIAVMGTVCFATFATSRTLHAPSEASAQELMIILAPKAF